MPCAPPSARDPPIRHLNFLALRTLELLLALVRSAGRYPPQALFRTYLYAIGLKLVRAHCRKATFRALFLGTSSSDPVKHDGVESARWVRRAVAKLAPLDREILMLREFEQLSYGEIADLLAGYLPRSLVPYLLS